MQSGLAQVMHDAWHPAQACSPEPVANIALLGLAAPALLIQAVWLGARAMLSSNLRQRSSGDVLLKVRCTQELLPNLA